MRRRKRTTLLSHLTDKRREPATDQIWRSSGIAVAGGLGDVEGPASAGDDNLATFDGLTGKLIQDSGVDISVLTGLASTYQPLNAILTDLAGLTQATDRLPYMDSATTMALATFTGFARTLLDDADAATARTTLGLGTGDSPQFTGVNVGHASDTTVARPSAGDISVEGNIIYRAGGTDVPVADGGTGASTASGARTNLGLGDVATLDQDDSLPWNIDIDPYLTPITQTNWSTLSVSAVFVNNCYLLSSGAQNAEIGWDVILAAGTWTFAILHSKGSNHGIVTVSLDGSSIGTIDEYSAGASNNQRDTITSVAVATTGKKRLLLKMATKHASSTNYFGGIQAVGFRRTA